MLASRDINIYIHVRIPDSLHVSVCWHRPFFFVSCLVHVDCLEQFSFLCHHHQLLDMAATVCVSLLCHTATDKVIWSLSMSCILFTSYLASGRVITAAAYRWHGLHEVTLNIHCTIKQNVLNGIFVWLELKTGKQSCCTLLTVRTPTHQYSCITQAVVKYNVVTMKNKSIFSI